MLLEQACQKPRSVETASPASPQARLAMAHNYAVIGAFRFAREACALLVADELAVIGADLALTLGTVEVLLLSEGYEQLARFLRAVTGALIVIEAAPLPHGADQPDFAMHATATGLHVLVKAGALRRPDAVDVARRWSADILQMVNR